MPTTLLHGESWNQAYTRRFQEEAYADAQILRHAENAKEQWIDERVAQILEDNDYVMELAQTVAEDKPEILLALFKATSQDYITALSEYHLAITKSARHMATGEALRRFS